VDPDRRYRSVVAREPWSRGEAVGERLYLAEASEVEDDEIEAFIAQGRPIAGARIGDRFYAIEVRRIHEEDCSLSEGIFLEEETAVCPCHSSEFDPAPGDPRALPAKARSP
jgi:nitrite reductase/ring-hydroxylating ferredoxin subunit